jgi:ABC-type sugar transport system substrate-binding protein
MAIVWDLEFALASAATAFLLVAGLLLDRLIRARGLLQRGKKLGWIWFLILCGLLLVWSLVYYLRSRDFPTSASIYLGVEGILAGLFATYLGRPGKRKVALVGKARNNFTAMLIKGAAERLTPETGLELIEAYAEESASETAHGVTAKLGALAVREADAVIVVPGDVDDHLMHEVYGLVRRRATVIICDARLDDNYFHERGVRPPVYVGSNFAHGGRLLASKLREKCRGSDLVFLVCGPAGNRPAVERGRALLYELMLSPCAHRVAAVEIFSWDESEIIRIFDSEIMSKVTAAPAASPDRTIYIYCGNDENAMIIDSRIKDLPEAQSLRFCLIGFDGVRDSRGRLLISASDHILATMDTLPAEIGRSAADLLIKVRDRSAHSQQSAVIVDPVYWERKH